ncbi:hypothetical protein TTHERM_00994110 (macronuclear) [Tetrahymena thermophila SB210]|uniref:Uncharacterized protein n=1 Tax=Tetrahymena thermophila (strain SB210) TaxID=312017 RepID=Q247T6_TETTS|nr:hypothetical protein TTHERM_00994110 [Tetrahymena thermophila SB210]EAS04014.1 hypothetical protein TTHERM_00994110 [Tetrahymena thermophila SB210]|eukprot:XP_001024259.1 hypothetical protein TTHERM_00994110 [Tetrahymena thermophila SB210]
MSNISVQIRKQIYINHQDFYDGKDSILDIIQVHIIANRAFVSPSQLSNQNSQMLIDEIITLDNIPQNIMKSFQLQHIFLFETINF